MNRRICVVGGGNWGKKHINSLNKFGVLSGIVDSSPQIINELKPQYPEVSFFSNIDDALEVDFDGFIVVTPAQSHYIIAKKILESNHHVLVEKPITTKIEEAVELNRIAKSKNLNLMVGHVLLFHPAFMKIKQMLKSDYLGNLQYIYSNRLNLGTIRTEENVFWSFAPHDIALFQYMTDTKPVKIHSVGNDILQPGIHDTTITTFEYPDSIMGHIFVSWLHPFKEHRFVVVGSKGMISFEDSLDEKPLIYYDKSVDWKKNIPILKNGPSKVIEYDKKMPLDIELEYFINHLDGSPLLLANGESAIDVMDILTKSTNKLLNG